MPDRCLKLFLTLKVIEPSISVSIFNHSNKIETVLAQRNIPSFFCVEIQLTDTWSQHQLYLTHNLFTSTEPDRDVTSNAAADIVSLAPYVNAAATVYGPPSSQSWSLPSMNFTVIRSLSHNRLLLTLWGAARISLKSLFLFFFCRTWWWAFTWSFYLYL